MKTEERPGQRRGRRKPTATADGKSTATHSDPTRAAVPQPKHHEERAAGQKATRLAQHIARAGRRTGRNQPGLSSTSAPTSSAVCPCRRSEPMPTQRHQCQFNVPRRINRSRVVQLAATGAASLATTGNHRSLRQGFRHVEPQLTSVDLLKCSTYVSFYLLLFPRVYSLLTPFLYRWRLICRKIIFVLFFKVLNT